MNLKIQHINLYTNQISII